MGLTAGPGKTGEPNSLMNRPRGKREEGKANTRKKKSERGPKEVSNTTPSIW